MRFASYLSDGFTTMAVINLPERKLAKRTYVHCVLRIPGAPVRQKLGLILENKVVQKLKLEKNGFYKI